jgi:hypothetical protein
VSVLFDEFIAEAGGNTGRQDQRTTCFLDMQIQALPGYRIAVSQADIRGFYSLKNRAYLQAAFYFETNGFRSPTVNRRIVGPKDESNWVPPIGLRVSDYRWSACGGTASINFAASMIVVSNSAREQTLAQLDSSDFSTNFQIVAQPCP